MCLTQKWRWADMQQTLTSALLLLLLLLLLLFLASLLPQRRSRRCSVHSLSNWRCRASCQRVSSNMTFKSFQVNSCKRAGRQELFFFFFQRPVKQIFSFAPFLTNLSVDIIPRIEKRFRVHMLRYSHGAERLRMHNIYSNMNNIKKTLAPLWLNKCPRLKPLSFSPLCCGTCF